MTIAVDMGRKATKKEKKKVIYIVATISYSAALFILRE